MHHHTQPIEWAEACDGLCPGWPLCVRHGRAQGELNHCIREHRRRLTRFAPESLSLQVGLQANPNPSGCLAPCLKSTCSFPPQNVFQNPIPYHQLKALTGPHGLAPTPTRRPSWLNTADGGPSQWSCLSPVTLSCTVLLYCQGCRPCTKSPYLFCTFVHLQKNAGPTTVGTLSDHPWYSYQQCDRCSLNKKHLSAY